MENKIKYPCFTYVFGQLFVHFNMEAILYIGISQTLFAGILIAVKRPRMLANRILAAWLLIICTEMIIVLINDTLIELYPIKILPYTYGPLLLLYAKWMTSEHPSFDPRYLWHFSPFFVFLVASLVFIDEKVMSGTDGFLVIDRFISFRIVYAISFFVSITAYSIATFVVINRHQKRLKQLISYSSGKITLQWLLGLSITFYLGYVLMFIFGGIDILVGFMPFDPYEISFIGLTILTFLFGVFGFNQPSIFEEVVKFKEQKIALTDENGSKKYQRSGLKKKDVAQYISLIEDHMDKEQPFLNRELTIFDLSDQLEIPRHFLSEVINEHMGKNFYNLVNGYRIEEVKRRLEDPEFKYLTILAIAYDSGFNAKSSFNTIFKEKTGMTPSEYQKTVSARNS
ncbi:MAG: helix-turn-helix transcriptional regulator [Bacteroidales bacterium]|nr:helix-turn-helix transcriptional regulator [Bacteroidales bacterium]